MTRKNILMAALMMTVFAWTQPTVAQERAESTVIENPQFGVSNTTSVTIDKVELTPDSTRLHMTAHHRPDFWIRISSDSYIRVNGEKLMMTSAEGIKLDKEVFSDETNQTHFVLNFPVVPAGAQTLDFIESDCETCFKIWDVALTAEAKQTEASTPADIRAWANIPDHGESLPTPVWKSGKAMLKGFIRGYKPEMGKIEVYYENPVTGNQEHFISQVEPDGHFLFTVPVATDIAWTAFCFRNGGVWWVETMLSPGEETEMYIDLVSISHQQARNQALRIGEAPYIFFRGANAALNNSLQSLDVKKFEVFVPYEKQLKDIVNMSLDEYKVYCMDICQQKKEELAGLPLPNNMKEYLELKLKREICYQLFFAETDLEEAFRKANKLGRKDSLVGYNKPVYTKEFYSFMKELDMNNPKNLMTQMYRNNVNSSKFIGYKFYQETYAMQITATAKELLKSKDLTRKEKKLLKKVSKIKLMQEFSGLIEGEQAELWKAIEDRFYELWGEQDIPVRKQFAAEVMGTNEGLMFDLLVAQMLCKPLDERMLIPEENIRKAEQLSSPFFANYMREKNAELTAELEAEKRRGGYTVHQATDSEGEALLVDIVGQFKGKVIFIDVWATWCGPCRSAMKEFEPVKEKLLDKDIAFVYLTDQTSPEEAWSNMIPSIKGEHYRLKNAQLTSLKQKFGFRGIPSYLIINKKGEVVYSHTGFQGNEKIARLLLDELEK